MLIVWSVFPLTIIMLSELIAKDKTWLLAKSKKFNIVIIDKKLYNMFKG